MRRRPQRTQTVETNVWGKTDHVLWGWLAVLSSLDVLLIGILGVRLQPMEDHGIGAVAVLFIIAVCYLVISIPQPEDAA